MLGLQKFVSRLLHTGRFYAALPQTTWRCAGNRVAFGIKKNDRSFLIIGCSRVSLDGQRGCTALQWPQVQPSQEFRR